MNLKETWTIKEPSYSSDVSHHITYDSITGVSWNTCIGTKIICIYIFVIKKREKQDVGVLF